MKRPTQIRKLAVHRDTVRTLIRDELMGVAAGDPSTNNTTKEANHCIAQNIVLGPDGH